MINNKAIELWNETNKLLGRIAKALEKRGVEPGALICKTSCPCCGAKLRVEHGDDVGEVAVLGEKRCPVDDHHPSCDCDGAGGWR